MGDGKTFEQALRALDKLIAEQTQAAGATLAEPDPVAPTAATQAR